MMVSKKATSTIRIKKPYGKWDLAIVGSGISGDREMTLEVCSYLSYADAVYCLPCCPGEWKFIKTLNNNAVNLFKTVYREGNSFTDAYDKIEDLIISSAINLSKTVYAIPGNPVFFAFPVQRLIRRVQSEGLKLRVVSGVSSFDLIISELRLEVGIDGAQIYNALDIMRRLPRIDVKSHCFFFQIGVLGLDQIDQRRGRLGRDIDQFMRYLKRFYPANHPCKVIMLLTAAGGKSEVIETTIRRLADMSHKYHVGHTLYIPPL